MSGVWGLVQGRPAVEHRFSIDTVSPGNVQRQVFGTVKDNAQLYICNMLSIIEDRQGCHSQNYRCPNAYSAPLYNATTWFLFGFRYPFALRRGGRRSIGHESSGVNYARIASQHEPRPVVGMGVPCSNLNLRPSQDHRMIINDILFVIALSD
jgi:hypothetical protein